MAISLPDRYASPRPIGRGGMGEIFLAEDTVLGREVAIKVLDDRFARDEQIRARFKREALTAARLSGHPNIVTIFDVGEADGQPFIVMEYIGGGTLADRATKGSVKPAEALAWLAQAASALDEAHAAGIVHRDVKPANLLLDERGNVHVADFGIARVADESTVGMTAAGTILGTAGYLSPEQARGEPAGPASDVYALGIVAYELLTGGRPFEGGSATAEAAAHINQPVPYASERGVGLPQGVDGVFARVLAKQPHERYGKATEFVEELRDVLDQPEKTTKVAAAPAPTARTRPLERRAATTSSRSRAVPAIVVGLLLAALAAGGVLAAVMSSGDGDDSSSPTTQKQRVKTVTQATTVEGDPTTVIQTTTAESEPPPDNSGQGGGKVSYDEAVALTDESTALMDDGNYEDALPLALQAYKSLKKSGELYEAYAAYNAGKSYVELGDCKKGLSFLDASEEIQGERSEIDEARAQCSEDD